jgi:putative membrane protein
MNKTNWIIGAVIAVVLGGLYVACTGAFGFSRWGMMGGQSMMGGYGSMMGWGGVGMMLFWALIIAGIVWLVLATTGNSADAPHVPFETPGDVLKRRYAAGEISKEQYDEMKQALAH